MNNPKISVLMPVYNSELYINEAIDSILNQTFTDFEFIIIDDASTDKSVEIIQSYTDSRIQLIVKPQNTGYTNSLNYGLTIAKGEYIARMDSDDISLPSRFEKQVAFLDNNADVVVCGTQYECFPLIQHVYMISSDKELKTKLIDNSCFAHPTTMIKSEVLKSNNLFYNSNQEPAEDYYLWVQLSKFGLFHVIDEVLLLYRIHSNNISVVKKEKQLLKAQESRILYLEMNSVFLNEKEKKYLELIYSTKISDFKTIKIATELLLKLNRCLGDNKNLDLDFIKQSSYKKINLYIYDYFFNRLNYFPYLIIQYIEISLLYRYKVSFIKFFRFIIKSLAFYKIKNI